MGRIWPVGRRLPDFDLTQRVYGPTHRGGHTLDLILTRATESTASHVQSCDPGISDHKAIVCSLHVGKPPALRKRVSVRNFKQLNVDDLCKDLLQCHELKSLPDDVESAVLQYDSAMRTIIDKHAPVKSKIITIRSEAVWYTEEIHEARRIRRKLERKWRKTGLEVDFQIYSNQRQAVTRLVHATKTDYYCADIQTNAKDAKLLFKTVDTLLHRSGEPALPMSDSPSCLANTFQDFFLERVGLIHQGIQATLTDLDLGALPWGPEELPAACSLTSFRLATRDDIRQLVSKAPTKSCELDSIPTWLLKQCGDGIIPSMTSIINMSLESGVVPRCFKKALVRPLLKKPSLDAECLKNYRPVSNLSFISKQTERVVAARLNEHMSQFELFEPLQSAYKARHSCETALIHVQNNILCAMDQGKVGILLLLDMSAAFETVDHITLLDRLHTELGIGGTALDWFESYLVDRHQVVAIGGEHSDSHLLRYGVPQGSVLGPQLFTVYTSPLGRIIRAHGLEYHLFADDSQLYVFVKPVQANVDGAIGRLEKCCHDISTWLRRNFLKLNDDKTEVLLIGSRQQLSKIALPGVTVGESLIAPATVVRDLGAVFDTHMTMVPHVNALCQSARYHIRNIGKIRRFLDRDSCEKIVHAFVTSRLDLNNALLAGLPGDTVAKLQKCQNIAARVVTRTRIRDHIKPVLMNLHWLPVEQRIQYKLLIQVYKALNGLAPEYIADLLQEYVPTRSLRSAGAHLLIEPKTTTRWGARAFSKAAPVLWNTLPSTIKAAASLACFKIGLKTYLYNACQLLTFIYLFKCILCYFYLTFHQLISIFYRNFNVSIFLITFLFLFLLL